MRNKQSREIIDLFLKIGVFIILFVIFVSFSIAIRLESLKESNDVEKNKQSGICENCNKRLFVK